MRFKTVAVFDNYEVVEPTEPVKRIEVIDIRKHSVASVIPVLFVFGMIVTWIVFGY